jgi:hypothetical protein
MNKEQEDLLKSNGFRCCNGIWYKDVKQYPFPLSACAVVTVSYHAKDGKIIESARNGY